MSLGPGDKVKMRTRTTRRVALPFQGFLIYLFLANILAEAGVVRLPLSYGVIGTEWFIIQLLLSTLQLFVLFIVSILIKRPGANPRG
jgi:hypothetical protein